MRNSLDEQRGRVWTSEWGSVTMLYDPEEDAIMVRVLHLGVETFGYFRPSDDPNKALENMTREDAWAVAGPAIEAISLSCTA